jgi:hypothetical protein
MKRHQVVAFLMVSVIITAFAFEWPLSSSSYTYGFGSNRNGFLKGTEFGSVNNMVRAAADGELTFVATESTLPGGYPLQGGSMLSLAHDTEIVTVYTGMMPDSISRYLKKVRAGDVLGRTPESGGRTGTRLYIYDGKERRFVNPLMVLPGVRDDSFPVIRSINLSNEGVETRIDQGRNIRQGLYDVILEVYDNSPVGEQTAPFEIALTMDGSVRSRVVYDASWAKDGKAFVFGSARFEEEAYLLPGNRVRFGPYVFPRGRVVLSVFVMDFAGNKREQTYSISVQ